eukprot:1191519-Prorocentrum_minimum.AAC.2
MGSHWSRVREARFAPRAHASTSSLRALSNVVRALCTPSWMASWKPFMRGMISPITAEVSTSRAAPGA